MGSSRASILSTSLLAASLLALVVPAGSTEAATDHQPRFQRFGIYPAPQRSNLEPRSVVAVDINNDKMMDAVQTMQEFTQEKRGELWVYRQGPRTLFGAPRRYRLSAPGDEVGVTAAHLDGGSRVDIAVATHTSVDFF